MGERERVRTMEELNFADFFFFFFFFSSSSFSFMWSKPFIDESNGSVDALKASFSRVERQIRSLVTVLENPDPVFEAFNEFEGEFERLVAYLKSHPQEAADTASELSDAMITLATSVKNAEFLIFKVGRNHFFSFSLSPGLTIFFCCCCDCDGCRGRKMVQKKKRRKSGRAR